MDVVWNAHILKYKQISRIIPIKNRIIYHHSVYLMALHIDCTENVSDSDLFCKVTLSLSR